jgi:glycerol kinase
MKYILALDQGTTSSRSIIFDQAGRVVATAQREFTQHYPKPSWVEHDAEEIWQTQLRTAKEVLKKAKLTAKDIAAIGITNQRETTVAWDKKTGKPVGKAIVWQDRRTAGFCDQLKAKGASAMIAEKTGLVVDAYFSATKMRWFLQNNPEAKTLAKAGQLAFGTIDSWLLWNLTRGLVHATDVSNASRTMLFNITEGCWDKELMKLIGIPASTLPEVKPSSGLFGETTLLGDRIPIAGMAGDQQAALFGQVCTKPGMVKNTYGTGCFMLMHTGTKKIASKNKLLTTVAWQLGEGPLEYAVEGSVFIAGAVVQWLRDGLGIIKHSSEIEPLAAQVPDTGGVYLVPAFAGLGAPHWDPHARALMSGITRGTTKAHIARAALEGIAYQVTDILTAMQADAGVKLRELRVDGGASNNNLLMQFQADLLGVPVVRPVVTETTALGAAYLAGLGIGYWKNQSDIATQWQAERRFLPMMKAPQKKALTAGWNQALERTKLE